MHKILNIRFRLHQCLPVPQLYILEEIAGFLGSHQVTFHLQDDKAKVPMQLTAVNKQAPLLMHLVSKVPLQDHNYIVSKQHKLVPSVIGDKQIKGKTFAPKAVTYSGPS